MIANALLHDADANERNKVLVLFIFIFLELRKHTDRSQTHHSLIRTMRVHLCLWHETIFLVEF